MPEPFSKQWWRDLWFLIRYGQTETEMDTIVARLKWRILKSKRKIEKDRRV